MIAFTPLPISTRLWNRASPIKTCFFRPRRYITTWAIKDKPWNGWASPCAQDILRRWSGSNLIWIISCAQGLAQPFQGLSFIAQVVIYRRGRKKHVFIGLALFHSLVEIGKGVNAIIDHGIVFCQGIEQVRVAAIDG